MQDYTLSEQFALVALNALDCKRNTAAKKAAILGIAAACLLQNLFLEGAEENLSAFEDRFNKELSHIPHLKKKERNHIEHEMATALKAKGVLAEIPNLLGCDITYYTASVTIREYRSDTSVYQRIAESIRAEILEPGEVSLETVCLLYLFRESGCMHDIFSTEEQTLIQQRLIELSAKNPLYMAILKTEFHSIFTNVSLGLLRTRDNLFQNPYLQGVTLLFPFLNRKQAIFIDMVILNTTPEDRRNAVAEFLQKNGHTCDIITRGNEHLLKIDNGYYNIWPMAHAYGKIPVQGVKLSPVYK